jgi:hypothetical protein
MFGKFNAAGQPDGLSIEPFRLDVEREQPWIPNHGSPKLLQVRWQLVRSPAKIRLELPQQSLAEPWRGDGGQRR